MHRSKVKGPTRLPFTERSGGTRSISCRSNPERKQNLSSRKRPRAPSASLQVCDRLMAATVLAGSIGTLALTSVRAAGAAEGNTLQKYHVPATGIDVASKTNEGVFSGRANRLFSTPLALEGDAFGIHAEASAKHHVAVSSRERGRKLQDEDDDDQCDSAITVTSAIFSNAEGCYENVDNMYYLSADGEHVIGTFSLGVGSETELNPGWVYGSFSTEADVGELVISAVCYYEDPDVPLDEIPNWACELDGGSVAFNPVSPENFSVSCGCSETTTTSTSENTPAPSIEQGQTTQAPTPSTNAPTHSPHSPTHFTDSSMALTGAPTMAPTGAPTMSSTGTPTMSPTGAPTMSPTGAPTSDDRSVNLDSSSTTSPTASPSGSPTPQSDLETINVGTLPFKMSNLGMVGVSVAAILVGLMSLAV